MRVGVQVKGLGIKPRQYHSATAFAISREITEIVLFGGVGDDNYALSDTTMLRFGMS